MNDRGEPQQPATPDPGAGQGHEPQGPPSGPPRGTQPTPPGEPGGWGQPAAQQPSPQRPTQPPPQPGTGHGQPTPQQPPPPPPQPGTGYGQPAAQQQPHHPPQPGAGYGQYGQVSHEQSWGARAASAVSQPGVIPLRPLGLGDIYDGAFKAIRANLPAMLGISAVVALILGIIEAAVLARFWSQIAALLDIEQSTTMTEEEAREFLSEFGSTFGALIATTSLTVLLSFLAGTVLTGLLIHSVSQSVIGKKVSLGELWRLVRPQILKLILLSVLIVVMVIGVFIGSIILFALTVASGEPALIVLGLLILFGLVIAGTVFVVVITLLATPALVLERTTVFGALKRSFTLLRRSFWRVTGIYLLTLLIVIVATQLITLPFNELATLAEPGSMLSLLIVTFGGVIVNWITTPVLAAVVALLYIDRRIRAEGLDAELARAAQDV